MLSYTNSINSKTLTHATAVVVTVALLSGCAGASKTSSGAKSGAVLGAGIGLLMGALTGSTDAMVAATAVGAAAGAGQGAYEGWRQDEDDKRTQQVTDAINQANANGAQNNMDTEGRAREELTRFLGIWKMEGWVQEPGGDRINVSAQVNGNIEMSYFVELAYIDLQASGLETQIWGSSTLGYDADEGYSISTRLNTSPEPLRAANGKFDATSRTFTFPDDDATVSISFQTPDIYTIETKLDSGETVESYRLTRT